MKTLSLYIFIAIMVTGCFGDGFIRIKNATKDFAQAKAQITNVSIVNDQLVLNGTGLDEVSIVRVTGPSGFDHTLAIESQTSGNLVANGLSTLAFAVGETFNLLLTDAYGAATFPVNFTLQDGSVTASKLDQMGASIGQVLRWSGAAWVAGDLAGLTYAGNWDGTANTPDLTGGGSIGEYYIVNNAGVFNLAGGVGTSSWAVGDWVVWNNVIGQWEKIDNATNVTNFNGRSGPVTPQSGDYTWAQINKTTSALSDIADVEVPAGDGSDTGKVLKWNNGTSTWELADDLSGGGAGSVTSTEISDGSIVDADINASAAIAQSKISGLTTDLAARLPLAGGTMTGDITFSGTQTFDGVDVSTLNSTVGTQGTSIAANTAAITGLDTDDVSEATNLYFTNARARTAAVLNSTAGTETDQAPSVAAMKSYVSGLGTGDILDGGNTTGAAVTIGTNDAQNLNLETSGSARLQIDASTHNVLLGSGTPVSSVEPAFEIDGNNNRQAILRLDAGGNSTSARGRIDFAFEETLVARISSLKSGGGIADAALVFETNDGTTMSESMRITKDGNVGIGNTAPDTILEIAGTLKIADGGEACTIAGEAGMIRYNTGNLEYCNGSAWQTLGVSGSGLTNFNGETGSTQTLANGTTGTAPAFVSATNTHILNIPLASGAGVTSGTISKTDYDSFAGKQNAITTGTTAQYLRGDLSLSTFGTDVLGSVLTGYSAGAGTVAATDTVLEALQKLDGNVAAISVPSDTDGLSEGSTNLYFTDTRARTAAVLNATTGTETDQAPSVAAMKSYVAANAGTGDILNGGNITGAAVTIGTNDAQSLNFETNNTTEMTILSNGNVGIGTTSPNRILDVKGTSAASFLAQTTATNGVANIFTIGRESTSGAGSGDMGGRLTFNFESTTDGVMADQAYIVSRNNGDFSISTRTSGSMSSKIDIDGSNIGFSDTDPDAKLEISADGSTSGDILNLSSDDNNDGDLVTVTKTGRFGIGSTTPDTILHIAGTLKIADGGETCSAAGEAGMIRYNTGNLEYCNGSAWLTLGVSGSGLTNFNGETGSTQTLATGATGTAPAFVSATNTHTLNIPLASGAGVTSGTISKTDYDSFAAKQAAITTGATTQYLRGDLSLSTFGTDVIGSILTGYSAGAGTVTATDTVLQALQKLDGNVAAVSVPSDTDGLSEGSTNLYFTNVRARTAAVLNTTVGTETDQAPSVAAMKSYVAANAGTGDIENGGNTTGTAVTIGTNDAQSLNFETNDSTAMTILSGGNIGIGTTSPSSKLHIMDGGIFLRGNNTSVLTLQDTSNFSGSTAIKLGQNDWYGAIRYNTATDVFSINTERYNVERGGGIYFKYNQKQVGIGVVSPGEILDIAQNDGQSVLKVSDNIADSEAVLRLQNDTTSWNLSTNGASNDSFQINQGSTNRLSVDTSGNVGIGTTAPTSSLQVSGAIRTTASIVNATSTVDFDSGNIQHTTSNCGAFDLHNLKDGGAYTFIVQGTTSATCSFSAFSDAGSTALTVHLPSGHGATTATEHTIYSIIVAGTHAYFAWVTEFD